MKTIKIGNFELMNEGTPFIVAEAGINHNGQIEKAYEMIRVAKEAGVDAVKFQTFKAEEFVGDKNQLFTYKSQGQEITESMLDMFKRYEFSPAEWRQIKDRCDKSNIQFLSTPQNYSDLKLLLELGIQAVKVGSDDFTNLPLLEKYASTGLPLILSCGMCNLAEVYESLDCIGAFDGYPVVLLLCTSQYPTPAEAVNLRKLQSLRKALPGIILGFSDHTQGALASSLAVTFGACFFEKHFTLDHDLPGPDHWFSSNPTELKDWVSSIRKSYQMLGQSLVRPTTIEAENKKEFRRYIVAASEIKVGEFLSEENITLMRVAGGKGLPAKLFKQVVGTESRHHFKKGEPIRF